MDLDSFYSQEVIELWQKVLGPKMHYHFGIQSDRYDPFDQSIINLFPFIQTNSNVLDCGCGWGGPATLLQKELNCHITGVTISKSQFEYIRNFEVFHCDLHEYIPTKKYDTAIFVESYTHLDNSKKIFNNFDGKVNSIIIKDYLCEQYYFLNDWNMHLRTKEMYIDELESCGYSIKVFNEIKNFWQPSIDLWYNGLMKLHPMDIRGQLKGLFELCYKVKFMNYEIPELSQCEIYATRLTS